MTILKLLKFPNDKLTKKSTNILNINDEIMHFVKNMINTMFYYNGIGIAAPQVNKNKNIIAINISDKHKQAIIIINPKIIYTKNNTIHKEGCLSFPNIFINVKRKKLIKIKFITITGQNRTINTNNLLSICIQHEMDHLNGITLYNKMSKLKKTLFLKKVKQK